VKYLWIILAAASLLAAERSGPFLGAGMGVSNFHDDGRLAEVQSRDAAQYRLSAGAFINKYFSVSLDYGHFESFEGVTKAGEKSREDFKVLSAGVTAHYPVFDDRFDLFASFGAGQIFWEQYRPARVSSSAGTLLYGAGVGVRAMSRLTFNVGYQYYQFGLDDSSGSYEMGIGSAYLECQVQF